MENIYKIIGVLIAILIPILIARINNKFTHMKYNWEKKVELLKKVEEFASQDLSKISELHKDRFAKVLFDNDEITYNEMTFFMKYRDADYWMKRYLEIRKMIKKDRDENYNIIAITAKYSKSRAAIALLGYVVLVGIAFIPLVMFNKYIIFILNLYNKGNILGIFLTIVFPILFFISGLICLKFSEKIATAKLFIKDFREKAVSL